MSQYAEEIRKILIEDECLKTGHFLLKSGLHSGTYCDLKEFSQNTLAMSNVCEILSCKIKDTLDDDVLTEIDTVVGAACGAIIEAYQIAFFLGKKNTFAEKVDGKLQFKRGTKQIEGKKILIVEDVITTGGTVIELMNLVRKCGGIPVYVASIVDRSNDRAALEVPYIFGLSLNFPVYSAEECPICKDGIIELVKPGSK